MILYSDHWFFFLHFLPPTHARKVKTNCFINICFEKISIMILEFVYRLKSKIPSLFVNEIFFLSGRKCFVSLHDFGDTDQSSRVALLKTMISWRVLFNGNKTKIAALKLLSPRNVHKFCKWFLTLVNIQDIILKKKEI